jgi:hypothetical protein
VHISIPWVSPYPSTVHISTPRVSPYPSTVHILAYLRFRHIPRAASIDSTISAATATEAGTGATACKPAPRVVRHAYKVLQVRDCNVDDPKAQHKDIARLQ